MNLYQTQGIVLSSLPFRETSIITKIYTKQFGLQTYLIKGIRKKSSPKTLQGYANNYQNMSILDLIVYKKEHRDIEYIKEGQLLVCYNDLLSNVLKYGIACYIIELTMQSVHTGDSNSAIFNLLKELLIFIDREPTPSLLNLPIYFSWCLLKELGFAINLLIAKQQHKDYQIYEVQNSHRLPIFSNVQLSKLETLASCQNLDQVARIPFTSQERRDIIESMQSFFSLQVPNFKKIKSIGVMQVVLG
ncbi:MAG: DNA repair protein RecO [Phycisphaerales bacterium]|nr:DNA repair protein RecO [Phycisphaerales bacterium]